MQLFITAWCIDYLAFVAL